MLVMRTSVGNSEAFPTPRNWFSLYLATALVYVLTSTGRVGDSDGLAMARVSQNLAQHGSISAEPCTPGPESVHCVPGVDGKHYAAYGLVPSIVATPATAITSLAARVTRRDFNLLYGLVLALYHALFSATVPLVFALWLCRLGISWNAAFLTAFIYAFASPAWHLAREFFSEPYFLLGLLGCCYFLCGEPESTSLIAAGACLGFAAACRVYGLILMPVLLLYAILLWTSQRTTIATIVKNLSLFCAPVIVTIGLIALSNQLRFGSVFKTGYHLLNPNLAALMSTPLFEGMKSLLVNGEVGIVYYVPWILVLPFLWRPFWRDYRNEAILTIGIFITNFVFFAKYTAWHGGWAFGPRMMNAVIPFLALPLAVAIQHGALASRTLVTRFAMALVGAAFLVQVILLPYPSARYFDMGYYNTQHNLGQPWWSGQPVLGAITSYTELFGGANPDNSPAHQYLLTFPNSVNLLRADLWLVKIYLLGVPAIAAAAFCAIIMILIVYNLRATLRFSPTLLAKSSGQVAAQHEMKPQ